MSHPASDLAVINIVTELMESENYKNRTPEQMRRQVDFLHGAYVNVIRLLCEDGKIDPFTASELLEHITGAVEQPDSITQWEIGSGEYVAMVAGMNLDDYREAIIFRDR